MEVVEPLVHQEQVEQLVRVGHQVPQVQVEVQEHQELLVRLEQAVHQKFRI